MAIDGVWVPIVLFSTMPIIAIGFPLARAYAKKIERGNDTARVPSDVSVCSDELTSPMSASFGTRFTKMIFDGFTSR